LTTITLPEILGTIGKEAFQNNFLKTITIPKSVMNIYSHAFNKNKLEEVTLVSSRINIDNDTYIFGENIIKITIPTNMNKDTRDILIAKYPLQIGFQYYKPERVKSIFLYENHIKTYSEW
jgi:hypothetical protein